MHAPVKICVPWLVLEIVVQINLVRQIIVFKRYLLVLIQEQIAFAYKHTNMVIYVHSICHGNQLLLML